MSEQSTIANNSVRVQSTFTKAMYTRFRIESSKLGMKESEFIKFLFGKYIETKNFNDLESLLDM